MRFMFMIYHDEKELDALPEAEMQRLVDGSLEYDEELRQSGHYIVSDALQRSRTARTIRVQRGKVFTTDGPFAETKEQLGGFFLIEAKDLDEACEIASRFPAARIGVIEVRPVRERTHSQHPAGAQARGNVSGRKRGRALVVRRRAQRRHRDIMS
jgi:hypothetical protein